MLIIITLQYKVLQEEIIESFELDELLITHFLEQQEKIECIFE